MAWQPNAVTATSGLVTSRKVGIAGNAERTVFSVMRREMARPMMAGLGDTHAHGSLFAVEWSDKLYLPTGWWADNYIDTASTNWNVLEVVYDGVTQQGFVNGVRRGVASAKLNTVERGVKIGFRDAIGGGEAKAAEGDFAELLIYDRALSTGERRQVETYLGAKWFGAQSLAPQNPYVWLDPQLTGLTGFSYARETGRFLLSRSENGRDSLWRLDSGMDGVTNATQMVAGRFLRDAQWTGLRTFAYTSREVGHAGLVLADLDGKEHERLFQTGELGWFRVTPDQKQVLFWGNVSNEPAAGIWRYELASGQLQAVSPGSDYSSPYAQNLKPFNGSIKLPSGRSVTCTIYPPAHLDRHRKYPLVLGNTLLAVAINGDHGRLWVPDIATCGAFVVIINRWSWWGGIEQWEENVTGVYQHLIRDPCIDSRQVYLFGASAETQYMSQLLEKSPGRWKGAVFLNPSGLPDFSQSPMWQSRPKILLSAGGEEHQDYLFKKFQADAASHGAVVDYVIHPGENHHLVGNAAQLERTKAIMHFIFEE